MFGGFADFLYLCNILKSGILATRCSWSEGVSNTIKNTTKGMIELYLSKVTESSETETAGKMYARVSYKQTMDLHDMCADRLREVRARDGAQRQHGEGGQPGYLQGYRGVERVGGALRRPERQGGFGYDGHAERGRQYRWRRQRQHHRRNGRGLNGRMWKRGTGNEAGPLFFVFYGY